MSSIKLLIKILNITVDKTQPCFKPALTLNQSVWCNNNCFKVNLSKSKVMHFRNPSVNRSSNQFILNGEVFDYVSSYQYLGLVLNEFLDYQFMAKAVARSASRALGLLIVKSHFGTSGPMSKNISPLFNIWRCPTHVTCYGIIRSIFPDSHVKSHGSVLNC
jgi:hypothetical protein